MSFIDSFDLANTVNDSSNKLLLKISSFAGVTFYCLTDQITVGRKGKLHEYPLQSEPWFEDLARSAKKYTVTAVFAGDNYIKESNKFMNHLENTNRGTLILPEFDEIEAYCLRATLSNATSHRFETRISLEFVEAGEFLYPGTYLFDSIYSDIENRKQEFEESNAFEDIISSGSKPREIEKLESMEIINDYIETGSFDELLKLAEVSRQKELKELYLAAAAENLKIKDPSNTLEFYDKVEKFTAIKDELILSEEDDGYEANDALLEDAERLVHEKKTAIFQGATLEKQIQLSSESVISKHIGNVDKVEEFLDKNPCVKNPLFIGCSIVEVLD